MTPLDKRSHPARVLLVEDDNDDVVLTREGFREARVEVELVHVENGRECMAYLRREGRFHDAAPPDLVLLDLNMPIMDGRQVLSEVMQDDQLRHLPMIVLSTSAAAEDIDTAYRLHCNSFLIKPTDFDRFVVVLRTISDYWFDMVELPARLEDAA